jgi:hypothetical protein
VRRRRWLGANRQVQLGRQDKSVAVGGRFFLIQPTGYSILSRRSLLALYENWPMISMPFAPSIVAFGRFVIGESWTAREKRGRLSCVMDWNNLTFRPPSTKLVPYVPAEMPTISAPKAPSANPVLLPGVRRVFRDRDGPFAWEPCGAILSECPDSAPAWAFCPMTSTSGSSPGRASAGRRSTTCRPGLSRTIGPTLYRSPTPSSMCSRHGSAISSMNCSGRADDLRGQSR